MKTKLLLNKILINHVSVCYQISTIPKAHTKAVIILKFPKSNQGILQQHKTVGHETEHN